MVTLFREIDIRQTKMNAKRVLKNYRRLDRISGRSSFDIKSPIITNMPRSDSYGNRVEEAMLQHADAEAERNEILAALMSLGLTSRQILYSTFCAPDSMSNYAIGRDVGYSERSIERMKGEALVEFAEAYRNGKLIEFR
ncbi:ArpU family phage packaging/lysis transcriptional regulator [Enterococcus sp. LJL90]